LKATSTVRQENTVKLLPRPIRSKVARLAEQLADQSHSVPSVALFRDFCCNRLSRTLIDLASAGPPASAKPAWRV
jgi:hypothetical protein